jgi:two-component system response regulator AtoC
MTGSPQVLIVERSPSLRRLLAKRFGADGYWVSTASGPRDALHVLRVSEPDVILVDVLAPDISGFRAKLLGDPELVASQVVVTEGADLRERVAFWRCSREPGS